MVRVKHFFKQPFNWLIVILTLIMMVVFIFSFFNAKYYKTPIGQITHIEHLSQNQITDEHHNSDVRVKEKLKIKVLNGDFKNETTTLNHTYVKSQADSEAFKENDKVLLHISKSPKDASIIEKKRDSIIIFISSVFMLSILIVGRKIGLQSLFSLVFNTGIVLLAIYIHTLWPSISLFLLMCIGIIIATVVTLILITGLKLRSWITIISTLAGTFLSIAITELVIRLTEGNGIKYETMSFLTLPPKEAFLASVLIGSLGAVMDVAITISSGMYEIYRKTPNISTQRLVLAGRNIGQDIMGTMTNILLFSYLSGSLPIFLIYLKNANTFTYTISMNWSLEIARALSGGIGIVLTIPITIALMSVWVKLRGATS